MDSNAFVLCVLEHFRDGIPTNAGILLRAAQVIAPGLVTVQYPNKTFAVCFDVECWELEHPDDWRDCDTYPLSLHGSNVRVLETVDHCSSQSFPSAQAFARGVLKATHGAQFYDRPRAIDLDAYKSKAELNA